MPRFINAELESDSDSDLEQNSEAGSEYNTTH